MQQFVRERVERSELYRIQMAISSYPSDILAANVSKDTTNRELLDVEGIDRLDFMRQNINLFFGKVNHVEYCSAMLNFPSLSSLSKRWLDSKSK